MQTAQNESAAATPSHLEPLPENLTLIELIRELNSERAVKKAIHLAPAALWSDIERLCNEPIEP